MVMFEAETWAQVPFHFWSFAFFVFGTVVGSFLNVVIHRVPLEQSIVKPPSHCPHCKYSIPWFLNIPLVTWLWLRGKCAHCGAPISIRYFLVELLTGVMFLGAWLAYGAVHPALPLLYCLLFGGLIAATFIDFEHFIIPDSITKGGMVAGFLLSPLVPALHGVSTAREGMLRSAIGLAVGAGIIKGVVEGGKLIFGRHKLQLPPGSKIIFTEESLQLPDEEIPYGDLLYRDSDYIEVQAQSVQVLDRTFENVRLRLYKEKLVIGEETLDPDPIKHMEVIGEKIVLPREAMGPGDVKFMGFIGAFLGWQGALFTLAMSSIVGAIVGVTLIVLKKHQWSKWLPYGPYLALAAVLWVFWGHPIVAAVFAFSEMVNRWLFGV